VTLVTIILPFPSHTTTGHFSFCIVFEGVPFPTSLPLQTFYRSYPPRDQSIAPRSATRPVFVLPVEETQLNHTEGSLSSRLSSLRSVQKEVPQKLKGTDAPQALQ